MALHFVPALWIGDGSEELNPEPRPEYPNTQFQLKKLVWTEYCSEHASNHSEVVKKQHLEKNHHHQENNHRQYKFDRRHQTPGEQPPSITGRKTTTIIKKKNLMMLVRMLVTNPLKKPLVIPSIKP